MSADDGGATIEVARPSDAHQAAELAAVKRAEYEQYSPVFWRVADHAAEIHEPFLAKCIADHGFSSFAARSHEQPLASRLRATACSHHLSGPIHSHRGLSTTSSSPLLRRGPRWASHCSMPLKKPHARAARVASSSSRRDSTLRSVRPLKLPGTNVVPRGGFIRFCPAKGKSPRFGRLRPSWDQRLRFTTPVAKRRSLWKWAIRER